MDKEEKGICEMCVSLLNFHRRGEAQGRGLADSR